MAIHELGLAKLRQGVPPERLTAYLAYTRELIVSADRYRELDRRFFFLIDDASDPRPLPSDFKDENWRIGPSDAKSCVCEGESIDLGGPGAEGHSHAGPFARFNLPARRRRAGSCSPATRSIRDRSMRICRILTSASSLSR